MSCPLGECFFVATGLSPCSSRGKSPVSQKHPTAVDLDDFKPLYNPGNASDAFRFAQSRPFDRRVRW